MSLLLSKILKAKLKEDGIGVPTLSKRTSVPRQTIANWISGQKPQNIEHVRAVADYFKMTIDELCFGPRIIEQASKATPFDEHQDEINAGVFEVVLRRVKK